MDMGLRQPRNDLRRPEVLARYVEAAHNAGIETPSLAMNFFALNKSRSEQEMRDFIDMAIGIAEELHAGILQIASFGESSIQSASDFEITARILAYACEMAAPYEIVIGSENQLSTQENLRLIQHVHAENFAVYFDTANPIVMDHRDSLMMLDALFPYVCEVHVKDFVLGEAARCVNLGVGDCRFYEAMELLKKRSYDRWLIDENALSAEALRRDVEMLRELTQQTLPALRQEETR